MAHSDGKQPGGKHLGGNTLTWVGHATIHIETAAGTSILVDPWITGNPSTPKDYKLPTKIDLLLLTHGHSDHTGDAVKVAKESGAKVVGMVELTDWIGTKGVKNVAAMNYGGNFQAGDVRISMVEARHSSSLQDEGKIIYTGNPAGFILAVENAPTIYIAGDTSLFLDMKLIKELYAPEVAILPIGDNYTMGPKHAAIAATYLGVTTVVPVHYGTFPVLTGTPGELETHLKASAEGRGIRVLALKPGESAE